MRRNKKTKSKKEVHKVDWTTILATSLMDLVVGTILTIIDKLIKKF